MRWSSGLGCYGLKMSGNESNIGTGLDGSPFKGKLVMGKGLR